MLRVLPLLILIAACKATDVPPRGGPDSSVLGVRVTISPAFGWPVSLDPHTVYFAKLPDDGGGLLQATRLVESNYERGVLSMLLNAEPGRYALVCAVAAWEGRDHFVYVSEKLANQSTIEIQPGQFVYMGTLSLKESRSFSKADAAQRRFAGLIKAGPPNPNIWQKVFPRALEFITEHGSFNRDPSVAASTEKSMRKTLARYGW